MIVIVEKISAGRIRGQNTEKKRDIRKEDKSKNNKDDMQKIFLKKKASFLKFFLGYLIKKGEKFRAIKLLNYLVQGLKKISLKPFFFFKFIIYQSKPLMGMKDYYAGRTKYRVPYFIYNFTSFKMGAGLLLRSAQIRVEKSFKNKLLNEILSLLEYKEGMSSLCKLKLREHYKNIVDNRPFLKHVKRKRR